MKKYIFLFSLASTFLFFRCGNGTIDNKDKNISNEAIQNNDTLKYESKKFIEYHFSIDYPRSWEIENRNNLLIVCKMNCIQTNTFCPNFAVNILPKNADISFESYTDTFIQNVSNQFDKFKLVNTDITTINGLSGVVIDYKMFTNETHLGGTTALILVGNNIVSINCMGENQIEGSYVKYRIIFERIIKSIKPI